MSETIPASTVVLLRDTDTGPEVLMLRRNSKIAFGGMWVFPGGRIDDADADPDELVTARRAAVREAAEEAGLVIDPDALVAFSHWVPPPEAPRRYATWFFLAPAPAADVIVDGGEIHDHAWLRPEDALARRDAGEIELAPPTWVTLHHLASAHDMEDAFAAARTAEPPLYVTRIGGHDGTLIAMWAGDAGYDSGDPSVTGPRHRLVMREKEWTFES